MLLSAISILTETNAKASQPSMQILPLQYPGTLTPISTLCKEPQISPPCPFTPVIPSMVLYLLQRPKPMAANTTTAKPKPAGPSLAPALVPTLLPIGSQFSKDAGSKSRMFVCGDRSPRCELCRWYELRCWLRGRGGRGVVLVKR